VRRLKPVNTESLHKAMEHGITQLFECPLYLLDVVLCELLGLICGCSS